MRGTSPPPRWTRTAYGLLDAPLRALRQRVTTAVPTHWHEFYEIAYVSAGSGTHRANGRSMSIGPGTVMGMTPADFHQIEPDPGEGLELINVIFAAEQLDDDVQELLLSAPWPMHLAFGDARNLPLAADLHRLCDEQLEVRAGWSAASRATLQRILIDIVRAAGTPDLARDGRTDDDVLRQAVLYLHHRFRQQVRLADVAAHANMSPNHFSGRFRALTGKPFVRYRLDLRLQFARSLLAVSDLPITDVCYAAGFNTLSHFERAFRDRWGSTPRAVRAGTAPTNGRHPR